ncbi:hypothetical protein SAMN04488128_103538 [Chitinophaga eiseniae]|uniref:Uncharacterized protein n=1 Tax=Chitinophaga eiseniae TaxID=634771 RepID=A0A1T4SUF4_9BACT|nr:hypothetical protein SAMN04488128_103538 [Chitinophaga eiseniae]
MLTLSFFKVFVFKGECFRACGRFLPASYRHEDTQTLIVYNSRLTVRDFEP